ncbi:hypothetical protein TWF191_000998 [Orbilia oligospora]|uniref:Uncharacterized protein n=1 Tax=Orbilia oligospora TaxID=2813651 RepID=A0A7C8QCV0_ORBOL|nr:hypothetical protein TWF191_000998 [Orbilia oligospora]
MSDFTVENEEYKLTARECRLPATVEKSRTAARIIGWGRNYNVRWRAPFMEVARQYMALLDSPRSERGFIGAAVRAFAESEIDGLTARFVETFQITGRGTHGSTASESSPDKTWIIVTDTAAPVVWPHQSSAIERREKSDAYCRLITDALKASDLTITSSFGAMIYVLLLSDELDPESLDESGIRILDYQGRSSVELEGLGKSLNQIGITIDHALSYCEDSRQISVCSLAPIQQKRTGSWVKLFNDDIAFSLNFGISWPCLLGKKRCGRYETVDLSKFAEAEIPAKYPVRYSKLPGQIKPLATRGAGLQGLSIDDLDPYELDHDPDVVNARIYNQSMDRALRDGEIVWLETDNPDLRPLPHPHLLWLHANISRVVRMCGRSGEYVYAAESDEEEEPVVPRRKQGDLG